MSITKTVTELFRGAEPPPAAPEPIPLTEEQMAAAVARQQFLQQQAINLLWQARNLKIGILLATASNELAGHTMQQLHADLVAMAAMVEAQ